MSDLQLENSRYVYFVLQYEDKSTLILEQVPEGWREDALEIVRNEKYHGITTQFTSGLKFTLDAKDFIQDAYNEGGLNTNLYLIKYTLRKNRDYVSLSFGADNVANLAWEERYRGLADFKTKKIKNGKLEVNFNSDELEEILKSHEGDDFDLSRKESLLYEGDDAYGDLSPFTQQETYLKGRKLTAIGEANGTPEPFDGVQSPNYRENDYLLTIPTVFVTKGFNRHVEVTDAVWDVTDGYQLQAKLFYDDAETVLLEKATLRFEINIKGKVYCDYTRTYPNPPRAQLGLYRATFVKGQGYILNYYSNGKPRPDIILKDDFAFNEVDEYNDIIDLVDYPNLVTGSSQGWMLGFYLYNVGDLFAPFTPHWDFESMAGGVYNVKVFETTEYDDQEVTYDFSHLNDIGSRLLEIMTGQKRKFYSKLLGRALDGEWGDENLGVVPLYQDYTYTKTGEWGNNAVIHGFALRRFTGANDLYKGITTSFKDFTRTMQTNANIGIGIENSRYGQRVRMEKLEYFYRDEIAIRLPNQISNVSEQVEPKMFISSIKIGPTKGGDYELGYGLDEPNISAEFVTPLLKTDLKWTKDSKYRSDETASEDLRRNPEFLAPKDDRTGDEHIWLLDLTDPDINNLHLFSQLTWEDSLIGLPTGIDNPESYHSWKFTPKRCLLRQGWVLRSGMEHQTYMNKKISLASSNANVNLECQMTNEPFPVNESTPIRVRQLERPRLLPVTKKFTHPISDELLDVIQGTTTVLINGEQEEVPNWYFKMQWINENGDIETGYLKSVKPQKNTFEVYLSNETMLNTTTGTTQLYSNLIAPSQIKVKVSGDGFIDWGDGTPNTEFNGNLITLTHDYNNFDGVIKFNGTLLLLDFQTANANLNHDLSALPDSLVYYHNAGVNTVTGNISDLPVGLKTFRCQGLNTVTGNISSLPNEIAFIVVQGNNTIYGNVSEITNISNVFAFAIDGLSRCVDYTNGTQFSNTISAFINLPTNQGQSFGPELIINGNFNNGSSDWSVNAGWNISGGTANFEFTNNGSYFRQFGTPFVLGKFYKFSFEITSGDAYMKFGQGATELNPRQVYPVGTHEVILEAISSNQEIRIYGYTTDGTAFSIDNISVKEVTNVLIALTSQQVDNILIDLDNSLMSAGEIRLDGNNEPATSASMQSRINLENRGVTIFVNL